MFKQKDKINSKKGIEKFLNMLQLIKKDDLEYIFRGNFSPSIVSSILDLAKSTLKDAQDTLKIKSKIYYIMGESLQNIARHHSESFNHSPDKYSLFAIHKKNLKYYITTGNLINVEEIDELKEKIDNINKMPHSDLREYSRITRSTTEISEKGGAGLGLIEIVKKSGNKLEYDFKSIDDKFSYFYLNTEIPTLEEKIDIKITDYKYSIENIKELHNILLNDNIVLFFKGAFNQNSLINLLSIVENQMTDSTISIKIYNLMVELLQNISKHADNYSKEIDWKPGIFLITESEDKYVLITGNYTESNKVAHLKEKLDNVNNLKYSDLVIEYNQRLQNFDINKPKSGLGLLDIKKKSKSNLQYDFYEVDDKLTFFMLQVSINKSNNMNALIIDSTKETPQIHFDPKNNIFEISNRSLPEDADEFYIPVIKWLQNYSQKPNSITNLTFKLEYFNTASARYITKIINILDGMSLKNTVNIYWYYREIDEDMQSMGEEYNEITNLNIELISY
ncbi:MAG: DUF1987 domain-containing protein [Bacteroidales bacterium]|nr:DUF1987 domain-containing protein [Bacteroidales bacterium]